MFGRRHEQKHGHSISIGATNSGKSFAAVTDILDAAQDDDTTLIVEDPHYKGLAWTAFQHLVDQVDHRRILFDRFSSFDKVLPFEVMRSVPAGLNRFERQSVIDLTAQHIIDGLSRRRDVASLIASPQTEEMTLHAVRLLIYQKTPQPDADLLFAFRPNTTRFRELVDNCTDPITAEFFESVADGSIKRGTYASALRLITATYDNAVVQARCGGARSSFDIATCIDQRKILLIEGGGPNVSDLAGNSLLSLILLRVLNYVRTRPYPTPKVKIWIDEANNANLIGASGFEVRALAELRKYGLEMHILVQSLDFPSADITQSVLQNCRIHHWHTCSADATAAKGASDLGDSELRHELKQLPTGYRYTKDPHGNVRYEQVPWLSDPYRWPGMLEAKALRALEKIRQSSAYTEPLCHHSGTSQPTVEDEQPTRQSRQRGKSGIGRFWNWLTTPRSRPTTSNISSPAGRLRRRDGSRS